MILNDIWSKFCKNIQSTDTTDYTRKIMAINMANDLLLTRWMDSLDVDSWPKEFLSVPTNLPNSASSNYVSLPSDFLRIGNVWYKSGGSAQDTITFTAVSGTFAVGDVITGATSGGVATITAVDDDELTVDFSTTTNYFLTDETITDATLTKSGTIDSVTTGNYLPINRAQFLPWDTFIQKTTTLFFNPTNTSTMISYISINNSKMYLDRYISDHSHNFIKCTYWKRPSEIYLLDEATVTLLTGTLVGAASMTGGTSTVTATIDSVSSSTIYVDADSKTSDFSLGETLTISNSAGVSIGTATLDTYQDKYQTLQWSDNHKTIFIEACTFCYFHLRQMEEAQEHDVILENMIRMNGNQSRNEGFTRMGWNV